MNASDRVAVNAGVEILKYIPGRVSTEIDARLSFNRGLCVPLPPLMLQKTIPA